MSAGAIADAVFAYALIVFAVGMLVAFLPAVISGRKR